MYLSSEGKVEAYTLGKIVHLNIVTFELYHSYTHTYGFAHGYLKISFQMNRICYDLINIKKGIDH